MPYALILLGFLTVSGVGLGCFIGRFAPNPVSLWSLVTWPATGAMVALISHAMLGHGAMPASYPLCFFSTAGVASVVTSRLRKRNAQ